MCVEPAREVYVIYYFQNDTDDIQVHTCLASKNGMTRSLSSVLWLPRAVWQP